MARESVVTARGYAKEPDKVKMQNYLRYHEEEKPEPVAMTPQAQARLFAGMLNAGKKHGQ